MTRQSSFGATSEHKRKQAHDETAQQVLRQFRQIFNEGWRNERDYLYVPNMHGANWKGMKEMYGELLPYVMHRADLNYLLDNMGAEIAIGHSYVRGGDMPALPSSPVSRSSRMK